MFIYVEHTDITTKPGVTTKNINNKIAEPVKKYAKSNGLTQKDFLRIIHIIDTDGVYIPDDRVNYSENGGAPGKTIYTDNCIMTPNVNKIIMRNHHKRDILLILSRQNYVWKTIPYKAYYMSCDLDHVLYDKRNSTDDEKERDSLAFAKKYEDDPEGFIDFISNSDFSVTDGYSESWSFISEGLNSLHRYTNLGLALQEW